MRRRRPNGDTFQALSLVPLADMLTNTVGIMIFILVFTVLGAGGASVVKRLPLEHATKKKYVDVLCANNRLYLLPDSVVKDFMKPITRVLQSEGLGDRALHTVKNRSYKSGDLVLSGRGRRQTRGFMTLYGFSVAIEAQPEGGTTFSALRSGASPFHVAMNTSDAKTKYFRFSVKPDSIEVFLAARALALKAGFDAAWSPEKPDEPFMMSLSGGRDVLPQ